MNASLAARASTGWRRPALWRGTVIAVTATVIALPLLLILYQSLLDGPFFMPARKLGLEAYAFVFADEDFRSAFVNSLVVAAGMVAVALPLGAILAFLMVRTDLPGRSWIEPLLLVPVFVSPMVLGFGYVVAAGPVGFVSVFVRDLFGLEEAPWNLYSVTSIALIAGLTHVPHVYLYASAALRNVGSDLEEAARVSGASAARIARDVSLPMIMPSLLYAGVLVFFLGFEIFGLALVLGDAENHLVLTTYIYKLTNKLGIPSYHLMAAVAACLIAITLPLVFLQRILLRHAGRYVAVRGKGSRPHLLPLGRWRPLALAVVLTWLFFALVLPLSGITLRAFVSTWGEGVRLSGALTLDHFRAIWEQPHLLRGVINSIAIGVIGGALAVACYTAIGLATHRKPDVWTRLMDHLVLVPRAVPGLLAGLAIFWVFLFFPPLRDLRSTLASVWIAYTLVWLAYGMRLISGALLQVGPELEEAARTAGATPGQVSRHVTLPLIRFGLLASWLLVFMIFEREYSTGVYLLAPGTEVVGTLLVSLWGTGAIDLVASLSLVNVVLVGIGLAIALRLRVALHD